MQRNESTNEGLTQRVVEHLSTAVLLFKQDFALRYLNPAAETLLAISARQALRLNAIELFGDENKLIDSLRRASFSGTTIAEREIELTIATGSKVTIDANITPINDPAMGAGLLIELQNVDRQLRILREETLLNQHNVTVAVVKGLAHEINNPLGGIRGAAQLLQRELPTETLKEYTQVIIGEADRLQKLLGRMVGPKSLPHPRQCNIHEILERVRTLVLAECPKNITLHRDYDPSIPDLWLDADQLIQAVLNVVRNAVQALNKREGKIWLRTRTRRQFTIGAKRHRLVASIEITDNGPGVPHDIIDKLFYPMVTGRADGTGLGLSIAQTLVNQHNGFIECASRPGNTTFTILLPLDKPT